MSVSVGLHQTKHMARLQLRNETGNYALHVFLELFVCFAESCDTVLFKWGLKPNPAAKSNGINIARLNSKRSMPDFP